MVRLIRAAAFTFQFPVSHILRTNTKYDVILVPTLMSSDRYLKWSKKEAGSLQQSEGARYHGGEVGRDLGNMAVSRAHVKKISK